VEKMSDLAIICGN